MKVAEDQVVEDDASFQDDEVGHFFSVQLMLTFAKYNIWKLEDPLTLNYLNNIMLIFQNSWAINESD